MSSRITLKTKGKSVKGAKDSEKSRADCLKEWSTWAIKKMCKRYCLGDLGDKLS